MQRRRGDCPHCDGTGRVFTLPPGPDCTPYREWNDDPVGGSFEPPPPHMQMCGVCGGDGRLDPEDRDWRDKGKPHPYEAWVTDNRIEIG